MDGDGRPVPVVDDDSYDFWHGGAAGELVVKACTACQRLFHPPAPICPNCFSRSIVSRVVSGRARLESYTVVRRRWVPGFEPPYVLARVVLVEQPDVHLVTNVVDCGIDALRSGMELQVTFEPRADVFVPVFRPAP
jgi:uncharacterized OB-fold protein